MEVWEGSGSRSAAQRRLRRVVARLSSTRLPGQGPPQTASALPWVTLHLSQPVLMAGEIGAAPWQVPLPVSGAHLTPNQPFSSPGTGVSPSRGSEALHRSRHLRSKLEGPDPTERSWQGQLWGWGERGSAIQSPNQSHPRGSGHGCSPCPQQRLCPGPRDSPATPAWHDTQASQQGVFSFFLSFFFKTSDRIWGKTPVPALTPWRGGSWAACAGLALPLSACFAMKAGRSGHGERQEP